jgi:hypothetical protein
MQPEPPVVHREKWSGRRFTANCSMTTDCLSLACGPSAKLLAKKNNQLHRSNHKLVRTSKEHDEHSISRYRRTVRHTRIEQPESYPHKVNSSFPPPDHMGTRSVSRKSYSYEFVASDVLKREELRFYCAQAKA